MAAFACGWALALATPSSGGTASPSPPPASHDRAFWRAVKAADFAVPEGASAAALVDELSEYFSSPDPALAYLSGERDLRAFDRQKGWYHATAHTADLLKFLCRSPHLKPEDAARVLAGIESKLDTAGEPLGQM